MTDRTKLTALAIVCATLLIMICGVSALNTLEKMHYTAQDEETKRSLMHTFANVEKDRQKDAPSHQAGGDR